MPVSFHTFTAVTHTEFQIKILFIVQCYPNNENKQLSHNAKIKLITLGHPHNSHPRTQVKDTNTSKNYTAHKLIWIIKNHYILYVIKKLKITEFLMFCQITICVFITDR